VQTRGDLVAAAAELAAGVQHGHHHLEGRLLQLWLQVDRDATPVVGHGDRAVGVDHDLDAIAVTGQRLVDRVVDELVDHVVQAVHVGVADVHARPATNRLEALEDLDVGAGVVGRGRQVLPVDVPAVVWIFEWVVRKGHCVVLRWRRVSRAPPLQLAG
jgi:hypothetical protein